MSDQWTANVQEDAEGQYITFTPEQLQAAGWKEGDTIEWKDNGDGSWTLTKKEEELEWVLVEAVQMFRMRYMVQVPKGKSEWALDTVTMKEAKEFSQEDAGEVILSHRVVSEEEAFEICDQDNDYTKSWSDEMKMRAFFTKDGEKVDL